MAGSFAALMAEAHQQTRETEQQAKQALANRQRKEEERRRQQEERERKERELEAKMRQRHFEEQQREKERQERRQKEKETELQRAKEREEERANALLGRKKNGSGSGYSSSSGLRRRRGGSGSDDDGAGYGAGALTREEKRERRLQAEFRLPGTPKRGSTSGSKAGKRLPGGAVDIVRPLRGPGSALAGSSSGDFRSRLAASPNTLIQLNTVKRDRRTIDEFIRDKTHRSGESKVLDGDKARSFNDWFGGKPKGNSVAPRSRGASDSPPPRSSLPSHKSSTSSMPPISKHSSLRDDPRPNSSAPSSKISSSRPAKPTSPTPKHATRLLRSSPPRKRTRSPSYDSYDSEFDSPPPPRKQRKASNGGLSAEIWSIFGKDRNAYMSRDVLSDDEDMEADALEVEREEKRSAWLARKEDLEAELEEKRREEEKRRRRMSKA